MADKILFLGVVGIGGYLVIGGYQAAPVPSGLEGMSSRKDTGPTLLTTPASSGSGYSIPGFSSLVERIGLIFKDPSKGSQQQESAADVERARNLARGIPENQLGPSGKPKIHTVEHSTRKEARDAARAEVGAGGTTTHHATPKEGGPHFHGVTQQGERSRIHHEYPR